MRIPGCDKATENLLNWTARDEWQPRLVQLHMEHIEAPAGVLDVDGPELEDALGETAEVLSAFIYEDFFTARFGENGESNAIDDYLARRGRREPAPARRYLEALRDSRVSLYEVLDADPGRSLTLRDLLGKGDPVRVSEHLGSQAAVRWDRLAARVVRLDGTAYFTGAILVFSREVSFEVLSAIETLVRETKKDLKRDPRRAAGRRGRSLPPPPLSRRTILRSPPCAQVFTFFWMVENVARAQTPPRQLRNTDDEPMVFCEVRYPIVADTAGVSAVLEGIEAFERDEEEGGAHWVWLAPGSPSQRLARRRRRRAAGRRSSGSSGWKTPSGARPRHSVASLMTRTGSGGNWGCDGRASRTRRLTPTACRTAGKTAPPPHTPHSTPVPHRMLHRFAVDSRGTAAARGQTFGALPRHRRRVD